MNNPLVWKTKDGQEILISNMTNHHLLNVIKYLERTANMAKIKALAKLYSYIPHGEMAEWYHDQTIQMMEDSDDPSIICDQYPHLIDEAIKRKLLPEYYNYEYNRDRFIYRKNQNE